MTRHLVMIRRHAKTTNRGKRMRGKGMNTVKNFCPLYLQLLEVEVNVVVGEGPM